MPLPIWGFNWEEMSMQTEEKNQSPAFAVINYVDLDKNMAQIATSGRITATSDYHLKEQIKQLEDRGYELVTNGFTQPNFDNQTHLVTFKHQRVLVTSNNLDYGVKKDDVIKKAWQIVHYRGAGNRTPRDNKTAVQLTRSIVFDKVTNQKIGSKPWHTSQRYYQVIGSPTVQGYTPTEAAIGGNKVDPESPDVEYTVDYHLAKLVSNKKQTAVIRFVDIDNQNQPIMAPTMVAGQPNTLIDYDPNETVNKLTEKGYQLVSNGFNPDGAPQFFDANDDFDQTYIMTFKHRFANVSSQHPHGFNSDQYQLTTKRVIQFNGAGKRTPQPVEQLVNWTRNVTADLVTGNIVSTGKWQTDKTMYKSVMVPVVNGFHTTASKIPAQAVTKDKETVIHVNYHPNGCIIPVDEQGQAISKDKLTYQTDPHNPTKVAVSQPVPQVNGYQAEQETITPADISKDTQVRYMVTAIHAPLAVVSYVDMGDENKQLASSGLLQGKAGQKITTAYSTVAELKQLAAKGYQVLYNNFDRRKEEPVFSDGKLQTFTIALIKTDAVKDIPSSLEPSKHDGEIVNPIDKNDDLSIIFDALKSLNSLLGLMMRNNSK